MNGGYFMVDCTGINLLAESAVTVSGLYAKCQAAMKSGKPIIANNMVWGDIGGITPVPVFMIQFDGYIIATSSTLQVIITSADSVTVVNMAPTNG